MRVVWSRTIVAGFWLTTAAYCLLSAIPFASEQFLKPGLVPALVTFAAWHPWISLAALVATGAGLAPWLRSGHRGARAFIAGWGIVGVALFVAPPLSQLEPSPTALVLALLALVPPCLDSADGFVPRAAGHSLAARRTSQTMCHATLRHASSRHLS